MKKPDAQKHITAGNALHQYRLFNKMQKKIKYAKTENLNNKDVSFLLISIL